MNVQRKVVRATVAAALLAAAATAFAHHSFAIFDGEQTKVFTGVVTRVNPDANHLQIFFAPMNKDHTNVERGPDGKAITWAVEMAGSAQAAKDGISVSTFPPGTVISVGLHPLRSGEPAGSRANGGAMYKCPPKTPPAPGKHCDSVAGSEKFGDGDLPQATVE